jgi:hypothetical protein
MSVSSSTTNNTAGASLSTPTPHRIYLWLNQCIAKHVPLSPLPIERQILAFFEEISAMRREWNLRSPRAGEKDPTFLKRPVPNRYSDRAMGRKVMICRSVITEPDIVR